MISFATPLVANEQATEAKSKIMLAGGASGRPVAYLR
jgi:hypothetical protein